MNTKIVICLMTLLVAGFLGVSAADRPNFSGVWTLDNSKSLGIPPTVEQTLKVVQTGDKIELELVAKGGPQGEQTIKDAYTLDGKEVEFTPQGATVVGLGKRSANWLPNNVGISISDEWTVKNQQGEPINIKQTRKWRLLSGGNTLIIDSYTDRSVGPSGESRRTFVKKS